MSGRAIDKIIAHFAATKGGRRQRIETKWGFDVWVSPWTLGEKDRVFGGESGWRPRSNARVLIVKAEDENGRSLFKDVEESELLTEADPDEVMRVAGQMLLLLNADNNAAREDGEGAAPKD